jgi:hypothetical protein
MLEISDFVEPKQHPFGMLQGYTNASEKEDTLAWMLSKIIERGGEGFGSVETNFDHSDMVDDGLLIHVRGKEYMLTPKAKGLLYSVYYKEDEQWE